MKHLLKYMKSYRIQSILAPLFKMLEASFELFVPLVMAAIIDVGIADKDMYYIGRMGAVLIALAVIGLTCSLTAQYFSAKAAVGFATNLRHALFEHLSSLSFTEIDKLGTNTMITRMTSDVNQIQNGVNLTLRLLLRSPFIVFGAMVMAFTVNVKAAFVFVVAIPLLSIVVFGIMYISIPLYRNVQAALDKILGRTRENLIGARVLRAFCKEKEETEHFLDENEKLYGLQIFVGRISAVMNPVTYIIVNVALIVLLQIGAIQVNEAVITQGEVVALVNYMSQILVELVKMATLIIQITKAFACAKRVEKVFEIKNSMQWKNFTEHMQGEDSIRFEHVSLHYEGAGAEALTDVHFSVKPGETLGIIGGTGSGKTSLINMIIRAYDATKGNVYIDGTNVRDYDEETLLGKIGIVPQKAVLFNGSIRDNLKWGNENATEEEMWQALSIAQAKEFVEDKQGGLDFEVSQGGRNLSGGQRQRLTIARAIVKQPDILILDDSASALDFATDAKLRKAIREMSGSMTTVIVSQRATSVMHADKIIVLDDGKVAGIDNHENLLSDNDVYKEIYYSQFPEQKKA